MSSPTLTPRPWKVDAWHSPYNAARDAAGVHSYCIEVDAQDPDDQCDTIAEVYGPTDETKREHAEYIVAAVNAHDRLTRYARESIATLRLLLSELRKLRDDTFDSVTIAGRYTDDADGEQDRAEVERLDNLIDGAQAMLADAIEAVGDQPQEES